ncbi:TPA: CynX/NimT family MFS transporter [Pseudomonas aeruginosa]|uniref:CynX/NimT family MFS transporter n=1 Tax=Pseudomonas TaxID=286 RepID=UPI001495F09B|nr:CynX/NimT family MFS transporter [Pseudomonas aeruginosa]HEP8367424.1 CynX/NimT family MFS transporter [Pseudomonas aeruginosa]
MSNRDAALAVARPALLIAGLLLIATNLRAPITGVAPVLETLQSAFALSPAQAGLLTTLPLLAFGIISPFAAMFAREYGLERSLFGALLLIAAGVVVRSVGPVWTLYLGTATIGVGIAVGNVLLPSLVKRDFPAKVPTVMGVCSIAIGGAAALASASAVPLGHAFGWQGALGATFVFPLVAALVWSSQLGSHTAPAKGTASAPHGGRVWHSALAWQVTLFMGINSLVYYVLVAWLPSVLTSSGISPEVAGSLHGVMQFASAVPGLLLGPIVSRMKDQRLVAAIMGGLMAVALLGFCVAPSWASLWAFCFGLGSGGGVLLALMFMGLRANSAHQAASLSGMAQCVGYFLAACGPTLAGKLHDLTGSWIAVLYIGMGLSIVMVIFGLLAGRSRTIGGEHPQARH